MRRDLTQAQAAYLMSFPLVNHVPHLHLFIAHAGILPSDPRLSPTDPRQPLAHLPDSDSRHHPIGYDPNTDVDADRDRDDAFMGRLHAKMIVPSAEEPTAGTAQANLTESVLRQMQETALLQEVPQNRDAWVVLNMRSVKKKGKVTRYVGPRLSLRSLLTLSCRNGEKGTPWSDLWNEQMDRCDGFDAFAPSASSLSVNADADADWDARLDEDASEVDAAVKKQKYSLRCHPATVVYGHAASRGLDVKRWSMGLDTGCLYGRKLTALMLSGPGSAQGGHHDGDDDDGDEEEDDDDDDGGQHGDEQDHDNDDEEDEEDDDDFEEEDEDDESDIMKMKRVRFGDRDAGIKARLVSVQCPVGDEE